MPFKILHDRDLGSMPDSILNSTGSIIGKTDPNAPDGERFLHCDDPI